MYTSYQSVAFIIRVQNAWDTNLDSVERPECETHSCDIPPPFYFSIYLLEMQ